jgi:hypothetical protein
VNGLFDSSKISRSISIGERSWKMSPKVGSDALLQKTGGLCSAVERRENHATKHFIVVLVAVFPGMVLHNFND